MCKQKWQESSLVYHTCRTKRNKSNNGEKIKNRSPEYAKAVRRMGWGLWWEGFLEKVGFESGMENSGSIKEGESGDDGKDELTWVG